MLEFVSIGSLFVACQMVAVFERGFEYWKKIRRKTELKCRSPASSVTVAQDEQQREPGDASMSMMEGDSSVR